MTLRFDFTSMLRIAALLVPLSAASAQKSKDIPLRITLHETAVLMNLDGTAVTGVQPVPSAIVGDGNDVYTNGQTTGATIKFSSGTHDAVLNLIVGKRTITANLPSPISASYAGNLLNIENILCYGCKYLGVPFVTRAIMGGIVIGGDTHNLRFMPDTNPSTTLQLASSTLNDPGYVNVPNVTSAALVLPQSYNCSAAVYPSWIVRGTLPNVAGSSYVQVGTFVDVTKGQPAGQFSMPFELLIEALQCFNPGY